MPHVVNPESGFVATANNRPVPEGAGPFLGIDWIDGYRVASIGRNLAARRDWTVAATQALQMDQRALAWEDLRPAVLAAPAADPDAKKALELLRGWDGRVAANSAAAAVYELFLAEMVGRVARARAPHSAPYALGGRVNPLMAINFFCYRRTGHLARLLREQPGGWFARPWGDEVAAALAAAVRLLRTRHGDDPRAWGWGRIRTLTMQHPMGRSRWLRRVFDIGPVPFGGDADVINQGAALPLDPLGNVDNIASVRVVIDVGDWSACRFSLPGGQSGNPCSPHYDDLFGLWLRGEGVPIAWTPEEVRAAARETLELVPAPA
jgi:penicillin amidase